jgi:hypothetical protein
MTRDPFFIFGRSQTRKQYLIFHQCVVLSLLCENPQRFLGNVHHLVHLDQHGLIQDDQQLRGFGKNLSTSNNK